MENEKDNVHCLFIQPPNQNTISHEYSADKDVGGITN
jgi:hypothetical protein